MRQRQRGKSKKQEQARQKRVARVGARRWTEATVQRRRRRRGTPLARLASGSSAPDQGHARWPQPVWTLPAQRHTFGRRTGSTGSTPYDGMTTLLVPTNMQDNQAGKEPAARPCRNPLSRSPSDLSLFVWSRGSRIARPPSQRNNLQSGRPGLFSCVGVRRER